MTLVEDVTPFLSAADETISDQAAYIVDLEAQLAAVGDAIVGGWQPIVSPGLPPGTLLRVHEGDYEVNEPGHVIPEGLDIVGRLLVRAPDCRMQRGRIWGRADDPGEKWSAVVDASHGNASGFVIEDSEVMGYTSGLQSTGVYGWSYDAARLNVHDVVDGFGVAATSGTSAPPDACSIVDGWVHALRYGDVNYQSDGHTHSDGIQFQHGGSGHRVLRMRIEAMCSPDSVAGQPTACVMVGGNPRDMEIADCLLLGGTLAVNMRASSNKGELGRVVRNVVPRGWTTYEDAAISVSSSCFVDVCAGTDDANHYDDGTEVPLNVYG